MVTHQICYMPVCKIVTSNDYELKTEGTQSLEDAWIQVFRFVGKLTKNTSRVQWVFLPHPPS